MKKHLLSAAFLVTCTVLLSGCRQQETSHPKFGKEIWVGVAALSGVKDVAVNGAAIGHLFSDGTFVQTVQLNVEPAGEKNDYAAWLLGTESTDRVFLGFLQNATKDVRHSLTFNDKRDLTGYKTVSITLQPVGKKDVPGKEIARGTVKGTQK